MPIPEDLGFGDPLIIVLVETLCLDQPPCPTIRSPSANACSPHASSRASSRICRRRMPRNRRSSSDGYSGNSAMPLETPETGFVSYGERLGRWLAF
jgi:hypothetical protein